ncbi:MAG TPA: phosphotransferase [Anaerolineaceae bacterium]|nr:phosphotransferase [Anaerolineaceae bacterium]
MKPYAELNDTGKLRRLRQLAAVAIGQYDLKDPQIVYHGFATNLLYRVATATGERFMLRLASPGWRTLDDLQSEALWVNALDCQTAIGVPGILPARSGALVLPMHLPGIPDAWNATLMRWSPGRLLGHYLTAPNLEKMGHLFAALHQHGAAWQPPAGFTTRRFEHWLSRGEENKISGAGSLAAARLPADHFAQLQRLDQHVAAAYAAMDRADLRIIHCDLWHDNIKLHRGRLYPIDFEDTVWGFRAHDIAMAMLDLLETVGDTRYPPLLQAFQRGYTADLPWPADPIEPCQMGRLLWKINWVARFQPHWLGDMVAKYLPALAHYEQTGQVICPPQD